MTEGVELIGTAIAGKYRIRRLVGLGGMGAVYEGEHVELGKRVAVKIIDAASSMSSELTTRFKREARAASAVESEHIVQVFDVGHDPDAGLFMVMEYLVGEDLEQRLRHEEGRRLDPIIATTIGHQTARALVKAHAARVIHRDLKPANIFLTHRDDGSLRVKVLDFGISKLLASDQAIANKKDFALTQEGVALGTPQYMSPEQAQGLTTIDHRTDIWSLGAVLYEAVAGQPAYPEAATYEEVIMKILLERPKPLEEVAPWVPTDLAAVIHDALQHDVKKRIPDCQTLANRLAAAMPSSVRGSTGPFNVVRSIGKIEAAPQHFQPLAVRPSYSMPAAPASVPDSTQAGDDTQVVIRPNDGGSFEDQSPSSATIIATASDRGSREVPAKVIVRASHASFSPEEIEAPPDPTMFQPPAWVGATKPTEGPTTLKTAVRSLTIDHPQTRGVLAAAATAFAIIFVGGGLMLLSRGEAGSGADPANASAPSVSEPTEPPLETVDPSTLKAAAPPATGTGTEPSLPPPVASHPHASADGSGSARPLPSHSAAPAPSMSAPPSLSALPQ